MWHFLLFTIKVVVQRIIHYTQEEAKTVIQFQHASQGSTKVYGFSIHRQGLF